MKEGTVLRSTINPDHYVVFIQSDGWEVRCISILNGEPVSGKLIHTFIGSSAWAIQHDRELWNEVGAVDIKGFVKDALSDL